MSWPGTITELLEATAARRPDSAALPGLTWAEMAASVRRLAGGLAREGVGPGDRVALFLPNGPGLLLLLAALARRGACAVLLNTRFRSAEIGPLLARARPSAIAVARDFEAVDAAAILAAVEPAQRVSLRLVIGVDPLGVGNLLDLPVRPFTELDSAREAPDAATPDAECLTFTTSGTTGRPKLVLHRQRSIAAHAAEVSARIGLDVPGACFLAAVPLCGTFGLAAAMAALAGGAVIQPMARFDAAEADATIRRTGVTHLVGGDDLLLRLAEVAGSPYNSLAFTGFANFHGKADRVMAESARLRLAARGVYGSSEAQALFALQDPGGVHASVGGGLPASDAAAFAIGPDDQLLVRGPSLFDSYLGDPDATARARGVDGWFRTGDLATAHPDGRGFDFVTRAGDALRLGGFLVAPEEIEGFLLALPGVTAAQVVAHDGRAVAFVVPGAGFDSSAVLEACRSQLATFKSPSRLVVLPELPMVDGPNGRKVQRARLREMAGG
ncbi:AMP-binding protein [Falsiroseomonas oryziterrae]|uniref:AMP-binding protein n=1 Tax=Falsiroseomonas oryziterrae TaxID=2911368 RepID=UPI001F40D280|nr:AMP-binding protein [Roseomonas sp. NPKOSM-4]